MCEKVCVVSLGLFSLLLPFWGTIRGFCFSLSQMLAVESMERVGSCRRHIPDMRSLDSCKDKQRLVVKVTWKSLPRHVAGWQSLFAVPLLKYWFLLCRGIHAKWESWVTDLLGEPQVRSSSATPATVNLWGWTLPWGRGKPPEETWTSLWKHSLFRGSCASWCRNRYPDFVPPPLQHQRHSGKGRKRGTSRQVQEQGFMGSKEKQFSTKK